MVMNFKRIMMKYYNRKILKIYKNYNISTKEMRGVLCADCNKVRSCYG